MNYGCTINTENVASDNSETTEERGRVNGDDDDDNEDNKESEKESSNCDSAYPSGCIARPPPDLDFKDISAKNFEVRSPDPHNFDGDSDGIGCER